MTRKFVFAVPLASLALAACGSSSAASLPSAAASLRGTEVHFCFVTQASAGGDSSELAGCGDQDSATRVARASLTSTVDLMGQTQTESLVVEKVASHEWVQYKGTWYVATNPFPPSAPTSIASLLSLATSTKKVAGIKVLGQPTTGYSGTITSKEVASHRSQLTKSMLASLAGLTSDRFIVYLNSGGRVVQVDQDQQLDSSGTAVTVTSTVQFSKFGEKVAITPPPANKISSSKP